MLYWICPECGRECSPAVRECPNCAAASASQPEPILALAENLRPLAPGIAARADTPDPIPVLTEPIASRRESVAFMRADLRGVLSAGPGLAELEPLHDLEFEPLSATDPADPVASNPAPQRALPSMPAASFSLSGDSVSELLAALQNAAREFDQAAISAVQATFRQAPKLRLLAAPAEVVTAPLPPIWQWKQSPAPMFTAARPSDAERVSIFSGPTSSTLAGPTLPQRLFNLDRSNSHLAAKTKRPSWFLSLVMAVIVILGTVAILQYLMQNRDSKASAASAPMETAKPVAARLPVAVEHPAARSVEIAGVRVVTGPNKRPQLRYIVINHASTEVTGLNIRIAVRSVDALSGPPLFSVSNVVNSLTPDESKEIRTDIDPSVSPSDIPDWQSLRTEVLIARE